MKVILLDSSYPINVRNRKIIGTLKAKGVEVRFIGWNRDGHSEDTVAAENFIYRKRSRYGNRMRKALNMWGYFKFIKRTIREYEPDCIIASHWDMLLITAILKKKGQCLIYENLDMPTSRNQVALKLAKILEKHALRKVDGTVFASRFFAQLYAKDPGRQLVLENYPEKTFIYSGPLQRPAGAPLKIAFLGVTRYFDVMKNLIDSVRDIDAVVLYFYGDGPDFASLKSYAEGIDNVYFSGRYLYADIGSIYSSIDLVWAVYPSIDYNVKYAISNKFHESLLTGVPAVFARNTFLGDMIEREGLGFSVDPYDIAEIKNLIVRLKDNPSLLRNASNAILRSEQKLYWEDASLALIELLNKATENILVR
jgi:glycosyltransferase involved in cell wall biosynthesis